MGYYIQRKNINRFILTSLLEALKMIRIAELEDAPALKKIATLAYGKYLNQLVRPPIPILHDYEEVAKARNTYVLVKDNQIAGMVTCLGLTDHLLLRNLAVLPEYQGKGLGRLLVEFVEAEARSRDLPEVRLWTRGEMKDNIKYYENLGYIITHRDIVDECARVYFSKRIYGVRSK